MPIEFEDLQTTVSFKGDILVIGFSPKQDVCENVAWLLLQERSEGKIGRMPKPNEVDDKMCIGEQPGVLFAADNYRSLDVVIKALISLRDDLKSIEDGDDEDE
jgi:hypothetical protein